ncbi:hypothetical protein PO909_008135 [Leuciscus waleckii]
MIEVQSQQGVVLGIVSLACLGCVYALCLCCRKKANDHFDDNRRLNTVIRPNQRETPSTSRQSMANMPANIGDIHCSYQNFTDEHGILEPTYVDPIPNSIYANDDDDEGGYENVFPTKDVQHDSDSCSYENIKMKVRKVICSFLVWLIKYFYLFMRRHHSLCSFPFIQIQNQNT